MLVFSAASRLTYMCTLVDGCPRSNLYVSLANSLSAPSQRAFIFSSPPSVMLVTAQRSAIRGLFTTGRTHGGSEAQDFATGWKLIPWRDLQSLPDILGQG